MSRGARFLGGIGFILSGVTDVSILSVVGAMVAVYTYPLGILFRGFGWILLSRRMRVGLYMVTGILVIILGLIFYVSILGELELIERRVMGAGLIPPVILWSVYSGIEATSYKGLTGYSGAFKLSLISILGIIIILPSFLMILLTGEVWEYWLIGMVPLAVSAFSAAAGFIRLG